MLRPKLRQITAIVLIATLVLPVSGARAYGLPALAMVKVVTLTVAGSATLLSVMYKVNEAVIGTGGEDADGDSNAPAINNQSGTDIPDNSQRRQADNQTTPAPDRVKAYGDLFAGSRNQSENADEDRSESITISVSSPSPTTTVGLGSQTMTTSQGTLTPSAAGSSQTMTPTPSPSPSPAPGQGLKGTSTAPNPYEEFKKLFEKKVYQDEPLVDEEVEDEWGPEPEEPEEPEEQDEPEAAVESSVKEEEVDEQESEDGSDDLSDPVREPEVVPVLEDSAQGALAASQNVSLASGLLSMDGMTSLRNLMGLYRTGRMFEYGQVSLDDLTADEMLASTSPGDSVPVRDRRSNDWHSFVQVYGQQGSYKGLQSLADASYKGYGLNTGLFSQVDEDLTLGLMFGVQKVSLNRKGGLGSASLESVRFGPFLSWSKNDWHVDAALVVAQNQYELSRRDSEGSQLKANFNGMELNGYLAVGYDLHLDHWMQGLTVMPMAEMFYSHVSHDGFQEKGQSSQALKVGSQSNDQMVTRLGAEASYVLPDLENPTVLNLRLGWQQQSLSEGSTSYELTGQGAAGHFDAKGFGDSGVFYGVSFNRKMSDTSNISLNYNATRSGKGLSHGLQLHYEWKF